MVIINGLKMLEIKDILGIKSVTNGHTIPLCKDIGEFFHLVKKYGSYVKATTLLNSVVLHNLYFIPFGVMERIYIFSKTLENIEQQKKSLLSEDMNNLCSSIEDFIDTELCDLEDMTEDEIMDKDCYMVIETGDRLECHIGSPELVIKEIYEPTEYICGCGKVFMAENTSIDRFIPEIFYTLNGNDIKYFCQECKPKKIIRLGDDKWID